MVAEVGIAAMDGMRPHKNRFTMSISSRHVWMISG